MAVLPHEFPQPGLEVIVEVATDVSVIGFPFGLTHSNKLGIWTRGVVATEFEVDYNNLPCFLIDARTRQGQSGSPVVYLRDSTGSTRWKHGGFSVGNGSVSQFLGIYSGRVNAQSDIGYVWRPSAIEETIAAAVASA